MLEQFWNHCYLFCQEPDPKLNEELKQPQRIYYQQRKDKGKVYNVHAPEVECISKGKAHKRYEFGVKVSVRTSSREGWHVAAQAHPGNPYDGHTLKVTLEQVRGEEGGVKPSVCGQGLQRARVREGDGCARRQTAQRQNIQAAEEVAEKTNRGGTRNQQPETRASDESQPT